MSVKDLNKFAVKEVMENFYITGKVQSLSTRDLIVTLMAPIAKERSLSLLADELLQNGLRVLCSYTEYELSMRFGLDERQAFYMATLLELGRRQNLVRREEKVTVSNAENAADLLMDMRFLEKEHFVCLFLNIKNEVIGRETISIGSICAAVVHPREVLRSAIRHNAASFVAAHNHPSGNPTPSPEDIQLTKQLAEAGTLVGIELLDHVIIGDQRFESLKNLGHF
ncbi:RadC family protein [Cohnella soli]|uniref:DNA repair protein RadC n=1 Tax=Cohnella soli TaxID=425005 RepID=A0ABW0HML6_9BACL